MASKKGFQGKKASPFKAAPKGGTTRDPSHPNTAQGKPRKK